MRSHGRFEVKNIIERNKVRFKRFLKEHSYEHLVIKLRIQTCTYCGLLSSTVNIPTVVQLSISSLSTLGANDELSEERGPVSEVMRREVSDIVSFTVTKLV